eukprot:2114808-Prymnesium_polylepis.1
MSRIHPVHLMHPITHLEDLGAPLDVGLVNDHLAVEAAGSHGITWDHICLLYTSPSPRDAHES